MSGDGDAWNASQFCDNIRVLFGSGAVAASNIWMPRVFVGRERCPSSGTRSDVIKRSIAILHAWEGPKFVYFCKINKTWILDHINHNHDYFCNL